MPVSSLDGPKLLRSPMNRPLPIARRQQVDAARLRAIGVHRGCAGSPARARPAAPRLGSPCRRPGGRRRAARAAVDVLPELDQLQDVAAWHRLPEQPADLEASGLGVMASLPSARATWRPPSSPRRGGHPARAARRPGGRRR